MMHRRSGSPCRSSATNPCIWPVNPIDTTWGGEILAFSIASLTASIVPRHQSCGFCSDQSGRGVENEYSPVAVASTVPPAAINRALAPVVPTSIPNRQCVCALALIVEEKRYRRMDEVKTCFQRRPRYLGGKPARLGVQSAGLREQSGASLTISEMEFATCARLTQSIP